MARRQRDREVARALSIVAALTRASGPGRPAVLAPTARLSNAPVLGAPGEAVAPASSAPLMRRASSGGERNPLATRAATGCPGAVPGAPSPAAFSDAGRGGGARPLPRRGGPRYRKAAQEGGAGTAVVWAGEGVDPVREMLPAAEILRYMGGEAAERLREAARTFERGGVG